jgi:hypothetical protein
MGCTGSKPMLLFSNNNNIKSKQPYSINTTPTATTTLQKGFILFNAKTLEYLKANEVAVKQKLIDRSKKQLNNATTISQSISTRSFMSSARQSILNSSFSNHHNVGNDKQLNNEPKLENDSSEIDNNSRSYKDDAIEYCVAFVLNYALNDFDLNKFKASNQLSMKQIRKDIMKKYNHNLALSKLTDNKQGVDNDNELNEKSNTLKQLPKSNTISRTMAGYSTLNRFQKSNELAFYKLAMSTVIREFGAFIQENFIAINEFQAAQCSAINGATQSIPNDTIDIKQTTTSPTKETETEKLKLKEALEVARQNFYKGKTSLVCLTNNGGYVVKEVTGNNNNSNAKETTSTNTIRSSDNITVGSDTNILISKVT